MLKNLDQVTARLFRKMCSRCVYFPARRFPYVGDARLPSLGGNAASNALREHGFPFDELNRLNEHDLIISDYNSWYSYTVGTRESPVALPWEFQDASWTLTPSADRTTKWDGKLSGVALSLSGRELAAVIDLERAGEFGNALRAFFQGKGLSMTPSAPVTSVDG